MTNNETDNVPAPRSPEEINQPKSRHKIRLAAIGGIAAVAILGGGITAVAAAASPSASAPTTSTAVPTGAPAAPGTGAPGTAAPTRPTPKPHLEGTVTSVSGSTVLIKDREGFTRTIVVSSKTTYSDGLKAALATGTKIRAEGTVDANGTSLDATAIGQDKGPMGGGPGGPGGPMGGRGGFGGAGPRGDHAGPPPAGGSSSGTGTKSAPTTTSSAAPTTS